MSNLDVSEWIKFARGDIHFAAWGLQDDYPTYHSICFLCQSSAEKYIKALLLSLGWKLKKEHDLILLSNILKDQFGTDCGSIIECLISLNDYIIESRYPGDIPAESFTREMAVEAVGCARQIGQFVEHALNN
jgi:HEPN domain-containing protein